ncbi:putative tetratricopeptide-like helical domain superfamily [Helianthus annuus]|nr:putative tetratricopeptide-like helical domain superfamily [Helianthus annuus]KAJ0890996.1 putative tetratricopeptide-like helical domain superfamily [Helianthus annuus]KAJ0895740.1 putative tetratricopeptide-like helical domain superfamily [Helianthus annuus]
MTVIAGGCVLSRPFTTARSWITSGKLVQKLEFLGDDCKTTTLRTLGMPKKLDQTTGIVRSLPIFANALLLTTPLEALAEAAACEQPDQSIFNMNMPLLLLVALIGATVGGLVARQRKAELLRLNEQLRQINAALKRQAKIESYAPALSYAPAATRVPDDQVLVDPRKQELISHLKNGKNFLRNQNPEKAYTEFKIALELARNLKDPIEEKKAARGLGASLQRQGKHKEAIKYHSMVLSISEREDEDSGNTEAFGAIADCYTEIGDLEKAATFYDQYIARLQAD